MSRFSSGLLRSTERSSNPVMHGRLGPVNVLVDTNLPLPPQKKDSSGAINVISLSALFIYLRNVVEFRSQCGWHLKTLRTSCLHEMSAKCVRLFFRTVGCSLAACCALSSLPQKPRLLSAECEVLLLSPRFLGTMREESVYIGNEVNSLSIALVHQHVLRFIVSEVKMSCSCYLKAKAIQSHVRKQSNYPGFGSKSTLSRIPYVPREQA